MASVWREVQESLAEAGWKRVLMDITTLRTNPELEELFDLAKLYWRNFPLCGRIALVIRVGPIPVCQTAGNAGPGAWGVFDRFCQ